MIFTEITENKIKKEYKTADEKPLMLINISYPSLKVRTSFSESFNGLFEKIKDNFIKFCEKRLLKKAIKKLKENNFKPYGAVMKFSVTYENEKYISVITDFTAFDGKEKSADVRMSFVWNKEKILLASYKEFISRFERENVIGKIIREAEENEKQGKAVYKSGISSLIEDNIDFSMFYLVKDGICIYFPATVLSENRFPETFVIEI